MQSPTRTRIFSPGVIHNRKHHSYFHCTISSISFGPLIAAYSIVVILLLFLENFSQIQARLADRSKLLPNATNATNPLVYKRLRLEQDALQVLGRFQRYFLRDEHKVRFSFNETLLADEDHPSNRTQLVEHYYYQNDHIEINSLTYDDLIFEAIDASYLTKLLPYFVASYDNKADLARASDKRLVSRSRCNKELDYLLEQLLELEHARYDSSHRMGAQLSGSLNAEVLTLLDAFGTEQPGLLMGNHYWPGNWRQCRKSRLFHRDHLHPESSVDFGARYCVASLRSQRWNTLAAERVRELDARKHFEHDHQRVNYARYHRLQIGICLPESCDSRILSSRYENIQKLATYKLSEPLRSYELVDLYCLPDETSELRKLEPASILLLIFLGLWVGAVTLATVIDVRSRGNKFQSHPLELSGVVGQVPATGAKSSKQAASGKTAVEKLVDCLSFMRNLERIFETDSLKPRPVVGGLTVKASESNSQLPDKRHPDEQLIERSTTTTITATCQLSTSEQTATSNSNNQNHHKLQFNKFQFLNCAKVLANWSIIFGHVGMLLMHTHEYTLDYDCYNVWVLHYAFSSAIFVDWHFAISGLLVTYSTFSGNRIQRHTTWSWLGTIVHRYLRLAPLYLLMFSFSQSLFMYTGEGPLWDYSTSNQTVRATCRRESLLYPLTLTSNLHPIYEECVVPSWYISSDFQFFLITPFLFVLLYKSPLLGWLVGLGIIGASSAARYHRYSTDERADLLGLMRPRYDLYKRNNWDMYPTYLQPQYRIGSYMVGMLTGHYIHMVLSGRWTSHLAPPKSQLGNNQAAIASRKKVRLPMELSNSGLDTPTTKQSGILNSVCSYGALITSCFIIIQTFFCTYFLLYTVPSEWDPYADYIVPVLYSIAHTVAALGFALFAVLIVLGNFTHIRNFMSLPIWSVLVRFNFILFIAQIEAIHWIIGSGDTMPVLSTIELFKVFICVMCLLYLISGIFTPLFELPISLIERNFIAPLFAPPPPPPPPSGSQQYQLAQKSNSETLEASSPVPTRRANSLANTTTGAGGNPKQAYELGHIAAGESIRLVSDQQQ